MRNPQFFREFILEHNLARFSSDLVPPSPAVLVLPAGDGARILAVDRICDRGDGRTGANLVGRAKIGSTRTDLECSSACSPVAGWSCRSCFFRSRSRSFPATFFPRFPPAPCCSRIICAGISNSEATVSKGLAVLHALLAAAPIVPALLIAYLSPSTGFRRGSRCWSRLAIAFVLCAAIALTLVRRLRLRMLRFVTLIPGRTYGGAVLKLGSDMQSIRRSRRVRWRRRLRDRDPAAASRRFIAFRRELEYRAHVLSQPDDVSYDWGTVPAVRTSAGSPGEWKVKSRSTVRAPRFLPRPLRAATVDYYWVGAKRSNIGQSAPQDR